MTNDATVDNNLVLVVAEELKFAAPSFAGIARLVTDVCIDPLELPAGSKQTRCRRSSRCRIARSSPSRRRG